MCACLYMENPREIQSRENKQQNVIILAQKAEKIFLKQFFVRHENWSKRKFRFVERKTRKVSNKTKRFNKLLAILRHEIDFSHSFVRFLWHEIKRKKTRTGFSSSMSQECRTVLFNEAMSIETVETPSEKTRRYINNLGRRKEKKIGEKNIEENRIFVILDRKISTFLPSTSNEFSVQIFFGITEKKNKPMSGR